MAGIPNGRFVPGTADALVQQINLIISAKNLKDKDALSKSDPMCVVWSANRDGTWSEHGRTEVVMNSLNPEFATHIGIAYRFEELQKLKFSVHDVDNPAGGLNSQDFLGEATCTLGQIVSSDRLALPLAPHGGQIIVEAHDISNNKEELELHFSAQQLPKSSLLSEPDPFLAIYRISSNGQTLIHRTSHVNNTRRPNWPKFAAPLYLFQKEGEPGEILIQCLNHNGNGNHKLIGQVQMNCSALFESPKTFELHNSTKKGTKGGGQLVLHEARRRAIYSFVDYVHSGNTELNCTFAIDFTASNGAPNKPNSLHYLYGNGPTKYEIALRSVGQIIQDYDKDKQFPVLGFGARIPPAFQLSHEFFVNMSASPFCSGIDGVVDAYRKCLPLVELYGPTNFAPVIRHVVNFASHYASGDHYFILLILTDGIINDMAQTKQALVDASALPISVIIVGIGDADFSAMNELDGDGCLLIANGRRAQRDIVQFVAFNAYLHYPDAYQASEALARDLLAEIPQQLVSFMKSRGIVPRKHIWSS